MDMKLRHLAGTTFIVLVIMMMIYLVMTPMRPSEGFVDADRCGVDLPSCQGERVRCINGYCKSDVAPKMPLLSDLPMLPPTRYPYA